MLDIAAVNLIARQHAALYSWRDFLLTFGTPVMFDSWMQLSCEVPTTSTFATAHMWTICRPHFFLYFQYGSSWGQLLTSGPKKNSEGLFGLMPPGIVSIVI